MMKDLQKKEKKEIENEWHVWKDVTFSNFFHDDASTHHLLTKKKRRKKKKLNKNDSFQQQSMLILDLGLSFSTLNLNKL